MEDSSQSSLFDSCSTSNQEISLIDDIIVAFKSNYDPKAAAKKLTDWGLVAADGQLICDKCRQGPLKLCLDTNRIDSLRWYCNRSYVKPKRKRRKCKYTLEFRAGTIFAASRLPLWKILAFIYLWIKKTPFPLIKELAAIRGPATLGIWASFLADILSEFFDVPQIIEGETTAPENEHEEESQLLMSKRARACAMRDSFLKHCEEKGLYPTREFFRLAGEVYDQKKFNPTTNIIKIKEEIDLGDYD